MPGREFTVTIMGTPGIGDGLTALPIVEQDYDAFPPELAHFASYEVKWFFEDSEAGRHACLCPADLAPSQRDEIEQLAMQAFTALGCRDVARVDMRMDGDGRPQPGDQHVARCTTTRSRPCIPVARAAGWDYTRMVGEVLSAPSRASTHRARSSSARPVQQVPGVLS
jgi:D-alanine-D-alanine ligase